MSKKLFSFLLLFGIILGNPGVGSALSRNLNLASCSRSCYNISGKVTDKTTRQVLSGVTVYSETSQIQAVSDSNGRYSLRVPQADNSQVIRAEKEDYISYTTRFTLYGDTTLNIQLEPKPKLPDLIVTQISFEKKILSVTDDVFVDVTIKNIGEGSVDASVTPFLITLSDQKDWEDHVTFGGEFPTEGDSILDPQEESMVTLRLPYKIREFKLRNNPHLFTATVDAESQVEESDEMNNSLEKTTRFVNDNIVVTDSFFVSDETTTYSQAPTYLTWMDPKNFEYDAYTIRYYYSGTENCNGDACTPTPAFNNVLYSQTNEAGLTYMVGYLDHSDIDMVHEWDVLKFTEESSDNQRHTVSTTLSRSGTYYFVVEYVQGTYIPEDNEYFYSNVLRLEFGEPQLFVSLNENNPSLSTIPKGAQGVELMKIDFEAPRYNGDVEVTEIEFGHNGSYEVTLSDFTNFYLLKGDEILSSRLTIDPVRNIVRFSDLSFIIPSGTKQTLTLQGDVDVNARSDDQHFFDIRTEHDIFTNNEIDVELLETIQSSVFTISEDSVGSLTIARNGTIPKHDVGEYDTKIAEFSLTTGSHEDVSFKSISLKVSGTIGLNDISGFRLYKVIPSTETEEPSGSSAETIEPTQTETSDSTNNLSFLTHLAYDEALDSDRFIELQLYSPYIIPRGHQEFFGIYANISGDADEGASIQVYLNSPSDIKTRGEVYGYSVPIYSDSYDGEDTQNYSDSSYSTIKGKMALTVSLGDVIPGGTIPLGATAVKFLNVNFTASSEENIVLESVIFHRAGVGTSSDFSNVYLYNGTNRLTSGHSVTIDTHEVKFDNLNFTIPAGDTTMLTVVADMSTSGSNDQNYFELVSADKIESNAVSVTLSGNIVGQTFTLGGSQGGQLTIAKQGTITNPIVGQEQAKIAEFQLTAGSSENIEVEKLALIVNGTINASHLNNFTLEDVERNVLATDAAVDKDDLMSFVLDTPYFISRGNSRTFSIYADISGAADSGDIIDIYLDEDADLIATGTVYGYGVRVEKNGYDGSAGDGSDSSRSTIEAGAVTIENNGPSAQDYSIGADDQVFLQLGISSEMNIEVKKFTVTVTSIIGSGNATGDAGLIDSSAATNDPSARSNYADLRIIDLDTGLTLMGPKTFSTASHTPGTGIDVSQTFTFTDSWFMNVGTKNIAIAMDIENNSAISGDQVYVILEELDDYSIKNADTGQFVTNIIPETDIAGNPMRMDAPTLNVSLASSPASTTVSRNSSKVDSVGFVFSAGPSDQVTVTGMTLTGYFDENGDGTFGSTAGQETVSGKIYYLKDTVSTVYLYDEAGNQIASGKSVPSSGNVAFSGMNWQIPAGESQKLVVKTDILSGSVPQNGTNDLFAFDVTSITAQDRDGDGVTATGMNPNGDGTVISNMNNPRVAITVANSGTLTIEGSPDQVKDDINVSGTDDLLVAKYRAYGTTESFTIKDLTLLLDSASSIGSVEHFYIRYPSKEDRNVFLISSKQLLVSTSETLDSRWKASWNNIDIYVPKDESNSIEFEVYADTYKIESGSSAKSFDQIKIIFDTSSTTNFEAIGNQSNMTITRNSSNLLTSNLTGNTTYLYRSVPTVVTNADLIKSTSLPLGRASVYGFTVSADNGGDVVLYKMTFNVGYNNLDASGSGLGKSWWDIYEVNAQGNKISSSLGTGSFSTNTVTAWLTPEVTIGKGSKKYFVLEAPNISVSPSTATFADITVSMQEDTSAPSALADAPSQRGNFIWSDKAFTSDSYYKADWTNGYKVDGLPTSAITLRTS